MLVLHVSRIKNSCVHRYALCFLHFLFTFTEIYFLYIFSKIIIGTLYRNGQNCLPLVEERIQSFYLKNRILYSLIVFAEYVGLIKIYVYYCIVYPLLNNGLRHYCRSDRCPACEYDVTFVYFHLSHASASNLWLAPLLATIGEHCSEICLQSPPRVKDCPP